MKLIILLYLLGVIFLVSEIFLPGGIIGLIGAGCLIATVVFSFIHFGSGSALAVLMFILVSLPIIIYVVVKFLPDTGMGKGLFLSYALKRKKAEKEEELFAAGDTGTALTDLRPAGAASLGGKRVDVVTQGEYISKGQEVEIMLVEGQRVVVRIKSEKV